MMMSGLHHHYHVISLQHQQGFGISKDPRRSAKKLVRYGNADPHGRLPRVAGETCNLLSDVIVIDHIVVDYQLFYSGTRKLNV